MVDLFGTPTVKVGHVVNTVNGPGVVPPVEFLGEARSSEEVVAAPRATLVFVAQLADLDGLRAVAIYFDLEVDSVPAKITWFLRDDGTSVFRIIVMVSLGRASHCHGTPEQAQ